jgi:hypothetical protein
MTARRTFFGIVGAVALLVGAIWIGQGSGVFPYPASSFMVGDRSWIGWGAALAVLGIAAIFVGRRA